MSATLAAAAALVLAVLAAVRLALGPGLIERALALSLLVAAACVGVGVLALVKGAALYADLALIGLVTHLVVAVGVLKAATRKAFQPPLAGLAAQKRPQTRPLGAGQDTP